MPELPEVRAHAERLSTDYAGATLSAVRALSFTAFKTYAPPPETAVGHPLEDVRSRGKHLLLRFAPVTFVVHLMQGGRLRPDPKQAAKPRGGLVRWTFDGPGALLLTEAGTEHKAGVWAVDGDPLVQPPLDALGPEADALTPAQLGDVVRAHSMRLHGLLRDQHVIAGLGRRLANEILFTAQLSPFANSSKLDDDEIGRLHAAIRSCIDEGLTFERGLDEMSASKDRPGSVHGRKGEPCPRCGDPVRTVEYRGYTIAYCSACQTGGKVLADNTTSRFLK